MTKSGIPEKKERNEEIRRLFHVERVSMYALSKRYKLSQTRIRQIIFIEVRRKTDRDWQRIRRRRDLEYDNYVADLRS